MELVPNVGLYIVTHETVDEFEDERGTHWRVIRRSASRDNVNFEDDLIMWTDDPNAI